MRHTKLLWLLATSILLLSGCFEDKGNYTYKRLDPPKWLIDNVNQNIDATGRIDGIIKFKASDIFLWENPDRINQVRFEWRLNEVVISNELDFEISVNDLMKKAGITKFSPTGIFGKFLIIEKDSEIAYMCRTYITITDRYAYGDWAVLSEDGNNSKYSMIIKKSRTVNNVTESFFELEDNVYQTINGSPIPGKPINIHLAASRNISALGSATVMTDKVCYEISGNSGKFAREMKDDFLDGVPADFIITDRDDIDGSASFSEGSNTFISNSKGEVFTRQMSANYLGGKFISESYVIDSKGSKITKFGHHLYSSPNTPCWDEKNNRVVVANRWPEVIYGPSGEIGDQTTVYKCRILPIKQMKGPTQMGIPVWGMPAGTKALFLSQTGHSGWYLPNMSTAFILIYNTAAGKTMIGDFIVSSTTMTVSEHYPASYIHREFPDKLDENTIFLLSASDQRIMQGKARYRTLYTNDNKIRYIERTIGSYDMNPFKTGEMMSFPSKISFMTYDWYDCMTMVVGCENGDIFYYNIKVMENPKLLFQTNVGGKVVGIKKFGSQSNYKDYY